MKCIVKYLLLLPLLSQAQSVYPGLHGNKITQAVEGEVKVQGFDFRDVQLLPSPFLDNRERSAKWIMSLDVNRLLHSFRNNAGVFAGREGGYMTVRKLGGWESLDCELRGHSTGHILSALAYLHASTGEEKFKIKADSLVKGLAEVQRALGQNGFIGAYSENLINRNIAGQSVWAPWYTLHKIYAGLLDQYLFSDQQEALEIVKKAASWAYAKLKPLTAEQRSTMLRNEFGGTNEAFYNLFAITGDPKHRELAEFFYHKQVIDPLAEQKDEFYFKHANTFIPKVIGEARQYELNGNERSKGIAKYFWRAVKEHQTFCTGGNSHKEKFIHSDKISENLTGYTQETCNTNNLLKLTRHLYMWEPNAEYADFYERALYNHILGQQDPESGMVAYFLPLLPGAHKVYSTPEDSFWCCVGTGFENHAKYGEAIYYKDQDALYVNLFIPSVVNWKEKGLKIRQETAFPEEDKVKLVFSTSAKQVRANLKLRYPYWARNVEVKVNGKKWNLSQTPSSYISVDRNWKDNDVVEIHYPMHVHLAEANDNPDVAAVMYGPLVLAGTQGVQGITSVFSNPKEYNDYYTFDYKVPADLKKDMNFRGKTPVDAVKRVPGGKLAFEADGVLLKPIHQIHRERYVVYWQVKK